MANRAGNFLFSLLTILIEIVKLRRERAGAILVLSQKELDHIAGARHTARGIDSRRIIGSIAAGVFIVSVPEIAIQSAANL